MARVLPAVPSARHVDPELEAMDPQDREAAGREEAGVLLLRDLEGLREAGDEAVPVHLPGPDDDVPLRPRPDRGHGAPHDLAVALDLDLPDRERDGDVVDIVPLPPHDEAALREELAALRLLAHLLREDPERAAARHPRGPRLRVCEGELARLPHRRVPRLLALLDDDAGGPVDVRVRVPVAVLQVLPDEGVVRLRVPPAKDQEAFGGEGPPVRLEPELPCGPRLRPLRRPHRLLLRRPDLLLGVADRLDAAAPLPEGRPAGVVKGPRVPGP